MERIVTVAKYVFKRIPALLLPGLLLMMVAAGTSQAQDLSNVSKQNPFAVQGGLEARGIFYNANGIANRQRPFSYLFSGSATLNFYGLIVPFSGTYSGTENSFNQPFNQFGLSPTYKWITVHAGYRNIDYSPYTLGGHTILGAGVDLHPGLLRIGFMYGRLNSATKLDTTSGALVPYSFSRKAIAARLGLGTERNFFEFSYLKAKDDSSSVSRQSISASNYVTPAANSVYGYETRFFFTKYLSFESNGAVSVYTRDINSPIKINNSNNALYKVLKNFGDVNWTTEFYTALNASLAYRTPVYGLKVDYRRIDPDYKTMGAYFFDSDVEAWTFSPSFNAFKNRLRVAGNVGFQHDNLLDQKQATNKRIIASGNASLDITKGLAVDANYSNFSNDQMPNTMRFPDSLRIVQSTRNFTVTPRYTLIGTNLVQTFSISATRNNLRDFNKIITNNQTTSSAIDTKQYFVNYSANFPKDNLGIFVNINRTNLKSETINTTYQGFTVGAFSSTLHNKLQVNINSSFIQGIDAQGKSLIINSSGILTYRLSKKHMLKSASFFTDNHPTRGTAQRHYNEFRNELSYILNF